MHRYVGLLLSIAAPPLLSIGAGCASPKPVTQPPSSVAVRAEGVGTTRAEALADAQRAAVRSAIGTFIVSRTTVQDDELIEDKSLSLTDGYVAQTKLLREWTEMDGSFRVHILAVVVNDSISERKLREENIPKPVTIDASGAQETRSARTRDATDLLVDSMQQSNFPLGMFELDPSESIVRAAADGTHIAFACTVRVDHARWNAFLSRLRRCLPALGSMDAMVGWKPRSIGGRLADLTKRPVAVGNVQGQPLLARLTGHSNPTQPGPLDNVLVSIDPDSRDRTVMFVECEDEQCRAFTLQHEAYAAVAPRVTSAAARRPHLRIVLIDENQRELAVHRTSLDLNLSTGVLLLAEVRGGVPCMLRAGRGRSVDQAGFAPTRPLQLVPAIGIQDLLVRELRLEGEFTSPHAHAGAASAVKVELEW